LVEPKEVYLTSVDMDSEGNATIAGRAKQMQDPNMLVQKMTACPRFTKVSLAHAGTTEERAAGGVSYPVTFTIKALAKTDELKK
jgi:hypothetical protein